jgi:hypothetical protein
MIIISSAFIHWLSDCEYNFALTRAWKKIHPEPTNKIWMHSEEEFFGWTYIFRMERKGEEWVKKFPGKHVSEWRISNFFRFSSLRIKHGNDSCLSFQWRNLSSLTQELLPPHQQSLIPRSNISCIKINFGGWEDSSASVDGWLCSAIDSRWNVCAMVSCFNRQRLFGFWYRIIYRYY